MLCALLHVCVSVWVVGVCRYASCYMCVVREVCVCVCVGLDGVVAHVCCQKRIVLYCCARVCTMWTLCVLSRVSVCCVVWL